MEIAIQHSRVIMTTVKTEGKWGGGLEKSMTAKYGKPKKSHGDWKRGNFEWDRGGIEFISLSMENGVNEVDFSIDPTFVSDKGRKEKQAGAAKDF
jgi:hypothetical protein